MTSRRKRKDPATEAVLSGNWRYTDDEARANDAHRLLSLVAESLTACEAAGIAVKLKHGAVMTRVGYVLPLGDGEWAARTLNWTEFSPPSDSDDEDLSLARPTGLVLTSSRPNRVCTDARHGYTVPPPRQWRHFACPASDPEVIHGSKRHAVPKSRNP